MKNKVFFNNSCNICRAEINHYKKHSNKTVIFEGGIEKRDNLWPMIRAHVIKNPEFIQAIRARNKTPFNLNAGIL